MRRPCWTAAERAMRGLRFDGGADIDATLWVACCLALRCTVWLVRPVADAAERRVMRWHCSRLSCGDAKRPARYSGTRFVLLMVGLSGNGGFGWCCAVLCGGGAALQRRRAAVGRGRLPSEGVGRGLQDPARAALPRHVPLMGAELFAIARRRCTWG
jgi:hypothetical protein